MVAVLPYMDQGYLFNQFDLKKGYAGNDAAARTVFRVFRCRAATDAGVGDAVTHYIAMAGVGRDAAWQPAGALGNGFMGFERWTTMKMIEDGASNTIALMETRSGVGPWARGGTSTLRGFDPADLPLHGDHRPFGGHQGEMLAAMVDCSVRSIRPSIDPKQFAAMITIAGGEAAVDLD